MSGLGCQQVVNMIARAYALKWQIDEWCNPVRTIARDAVYDCQDKRGRRDNTLQDGMPPRPN
eukprot:3599146-Alexandrium_andersonii.AAC.1